MLVMPMLNNKRIINVSIRLKDIKKRTVNTSVDRVIESEIIANSKNYSDSLYNVKNALETNPVEFIRSVSLLYDNGFIVTSRENLENKSCNVYKIAEIPQFVSVGLDKLYGQAITDLQKEIPDITRGRYVDLEKLGVCATVDDKRLDTLYRKLSKVRIKEEKDEIKNQYSDVGELLDFIDLFDFRIIEDSVIEEDSLKTVISGLECTNSREYRNLNSYYNMAISNQQTYRKLSYINYVITGNDRFDLIKAPYKNVKTKKKTANE